MLTENDEIAPGIKYASTLGWDVEKRLAELRLRRELGHQKKLINWFLDKALETDNILYYRVMTRLIEIENEAVTAPSPAVASKPPKASVPAKIIAERDTFNPYACDRCKAVELCDKCFMELNLGGL